MSSSQEQAKKVAGTYSARFIEDGMLVGLGTGSTAYWFIEELAKRCHLGLKIKAAASSACSLDLAKKRGIPLIDPATLSHLDITVDGADAITREKEVVKGGGGAHFREKILAYMSKELVIIIDETKVVSSLAGHKLPVEISPFGHLATLRHITALGLQGSWRTSNDKLFLTENGNYLFDVTIRSLPLDAEQLREIPGVIDTGYFPRRTGRVVVGFKDGAVQVL